MIYANKTLWVNSLVRAIRTFAQSFAAAAVVGKTLLEIDWVYILGIAGAAAVFSLAMALSEPERTLKDGNGNGIPDDEENETEKESVVVSGDSLTETFEDDKSKEVDYGSTTSDYTPKH